MSTWRTRVARTTGNVIVEDRGTGERVAVIEPKSRKILFLRDTRDKSQALSLAHGYR